MYSQEELVAIAIAALREQRVYTDDWEAFIPKNNSQKLAKMVLIENDKVGVFFNNILREDKQ